jgi:hypothetical protein
VFSVMYELNLYIYMMPINVIPEGKEITSTKVFYIEDYRFSQRSNILG